MPNPQDLHHEIAKYKKDLAKIIKNETVKKAIQDPMTSFYRPENNMIYAHPIKSYQDKLKPGSKAHDQIKNITEKEQQAHIQDITSQLARGDVRHDYVRTVFAHYGDIPKEHYAPVKKKMVESLKDLVKIEKAGAKQLFNEDLPHSGEYREYLFKAYDTYIQVLTHKKEDPALIKKATVSLDNLRKKHQEHYQKTQDALYRKTEKRYTA